MQFNAADDCLLFFVDDTGHEHLNGQPVYGLGGCSVMAPELESIVRAPWREIRRAMKGSPDVQLHANTFPRETTPEQQALVGAFFQSQPFGRFGAVLSTSTRLHPEMSPIQTIAEVMRNRLAQISAWQPFNSVAIIFEASERADRLIERTFGELQVSIDGKKIPIKCFFMEKSAAEPALEVRRFYCACDRRAGARQRGCACTAKARLPLSLRNSRSAIGELHVDRFCHSQQPLDTS